MAAINENQLEETRLREKRIHKTPTKFRDSESPLLQLSVMDSEFLYDDHNNYTGKAVD